jgi:hypothetical protein
MNYKYFILPLILVLIGVGIFIFILQNPGFTINTNQTAVVKEIRELQRIETASFTIEKIIDAHTSTTNIFQEMLYGDKILLIAHGEVIAGFDLNSFSASDLEIQGSTVTIHLPPPQILVTKLDNDKTKVYDRSLGLLSKGDKDLESQARISAENSIRQAACEEHILSQASTNMKKQLTSMLKAYQFSQVTIQIPQGSCN